MYTKVADPPIPSAKQELRGTFARPSPVRDQRLVSFAELTATGRSRRDIQRAVDAGDLVPLLRGWYTVGRVSDGDLWRLRISAVASTLGPGAVISHDSAACVHGLPILAPDRRRVHVTTRSRGRASRSRVHHRALFDGLNAHRGVEVIDGIAVTSLAKTAVDLACRGPEAAAFVAMDQARRAGVRAAEVHALLACLGPVTGIGRARWAAESATGHAESIAESYSLARMAALPGVTMPEQQCELWSSTGEFLGRPDFLWRDDGIVGECDGLIKYRQELDPRGTALREEKRRENRLRANGFVVVRWGWDDLVHPTRLGEILGEAFRAARRSRR